MPVSYIGCCRENAWSAGPLGTDGTARLLRENLNVLRTLPQWFIPEVFRMVYVLELLFTLQSGAGDHTRIVSGRPGLTLLNDTLTIIIIFTLKIKEQRPGEV